MDAWAFNSGTSVLANASSAISATTALANDPYFMKVLASQKGLLLDNKDAIASLLLASSKDDLTTLQTVISESPALVNDLAATGITPLIYGIFFNHIPVIEYLLEHQADPDLADTAIAKYTPIMWAVYLNKLDIVKILLNHQADPYLCPNDDGKKNAISLVYPEKKEMYDYFVSHNIFREGDLPQNRRSNSNDADEDDFYKPFDPHDSTVDDDLANQIKLQSISASNIITDEQDEEEREREKIDSYLEERTLSEDPVLYALPEFDYAKLKPDQYLKFNDSDIPSLLDYIFGLRTSKTGPVQHETKVPASIVFQLLRYSHLKAESKESTEYFFDYFITRLRTVTNTKSGVFTSESNTTSKGSSNSLGAGQVSQSQQTGDIVLLSYWLSVIQFLHFYFCKSDFYKSYPKFLQELINTVQSLIATLSFSINSRLNAIIDECLLDFTNLVDVSNTLYAKDWNLFKSKKKHPNTYDDIFNMLYPPSEREMMKPSPLKFVQVLGALDYVLKLHQVDSLLKLQTFSQVFYVINSTIFNRIINQSRYCSRIKAVQIRLNLSTIEDWLRGHNYKAAKVDRIGGLKNLLPDSDGELTRSDDGVLNLLSEDIPENELKTLKYNPHFLPFYYTSLFHVGEIHLQPTIELLQWLQCMSTLKDEESLVTTINQFDYLNYYQIVKTMTKLYKYEVDETKIPKALVNYMKRLVSEQGENQVSSNKLHYMTQTTFLSKEIYIYLNPNFVFPVALPNLQELINNYGPGLGGIRVYRAKKYQPSLPMDVSDDVEELLAQNQADQENTYREEEEEDDEEEEEENENEDDDIENGNGYTRANEHATQGNDGEEGAAAGDKSDKAAAFSGDHLFKEVQLPSSLAHRTWGDDDIDANPW